MDRRARSLPVSETFSGTNKTHTVTSVAYPTEDEETVDLFNGPPTFQM